MYKTGITTTVVTIAIVAVILCRGGETDQISVGISTGVYLCKFGARCRYIERCRYCDAPAHGIHVCPKLQGMNITTQPAGSHNSNNSNNSNAAPRGSNNNAQANSAQANNK